MKKRRNKIQKDSATTEDRLEVRIKLWKCMFMPVTLSLLARVCVRCNGYRDSKKKKEEDSEKDMRMK